MKDQHLTKKLLLTLGAVLATLALTHTANAQATDITYVAAPISGDTDVDDSGTAVLAYDLNPSGATVNNVVFGDWNSNTQNGVTFSISASGLGVYGSYASGSSFSTAYTTVLTGGEYTSADNTPITLSFSGLTSGDTYQAQFFVYDDRGLDSPSGRPETLSGLDDTSGNSAALVFSGTDTAQGTYAIATFVANGSTEEFDLTGDSQSGQINAVNLRLETSVTVPEPSTYLMIGLGLVGLVVVRRARGSKLA